MNIESKLEIPEYILRTLKIFPSNESLRILQKYNHRLNEEVQKNGNLLQTYKSKLLGNENYLRSLQHTIDETKKQVDEGDKLLKSDEKLVGEWSGYVKSARKGRRSKSIGYQNQMMDFRARLYSNVVFNEDQVTREINELVNLKNDKVRERNLQEELLREERMLNFISHVDQQEETSIDRLNCLATRMSKLNLIDGSSV